MNTPSGDRERQSRTALRHRLRNRRRTLEPAERQAAEQAIQNHIRHYLAPRSTAAVALYMDNDGEPSLGTLPAVLRRQGHRLYLPVIDPARSGHMGFHCWNRNQDLQDNRFGIPEPRTGEPIEPLQLDVVLTPLVGFSPSGARLGMGAGYYDRAFAGKRQGDTPLLLGIAFACQQVDDLPRQSWDVPLDGMITEHGLQHCQT